MVSTMVVTLTSLVLSLTMARAFDALVDGSSMEELREKGRKVRKVASTSEDQKEMTVAARRHA